jgi:hypothetical protein
MIGVDPLPLWNASAGFLEKKCFALTRLLYHPNKIDAHRASGSVSRFSNDIFQNRCTERDPAAAEDEHYTAEAGEQCVSWSA